MSHEDCSKDKDKDEVMKDPAYDWYAAASRWHAREWERQHGTHPHVPSTKGNATDIAALTLRLNSLECKHYKLRLEVCYIWTVLAVVALIALSYAIFTA